ncbi:MAG: hypothetical protein DI594_11345 [Shewanella oneidensis]|nr:MAG: hypothetical protein DI594_11345 [Shewanella oneidensis]
MKVVYFPAFELNGAQHGGTLRTEQIYKHLCQSYGAANIDVHSLDLSLILRRFIFKCFINFFLLLPYFFRLSFKNYIKYCVCYTYVCCIDGLDDAHVVLEQGANYTVFIGEILANKKIKYDLYPHNIEFCVANQTLPDDGEFYVFIKISLKFASKVFVISSFDLAICNIFNENVFLFEYAYNKQSINEQVNKVELPDMDKLSFLEEHIKYFITFGSFYNPPTKKSLFKLASSFNKLNFPDDRKLIITGFGSDEFLNMDYENVKFIGEVSDEVLSLLIENSDGVLLYQTPTTGWLTKIDDIIRFNKPVFLNRSYIQAKDKFKDRIHFYDL